MHTETILERLFPQRRVHYGGVTFLVKPLPFHEVPGILSALQMLGSVLSRATLPGDTAGADSFYKAVALEFAGQMGDQIADALSRCVSIADPDSSGGISVRDLPLAVIPLLVEVFLDQNVFAGNWEALGRRIAVVVADKEDAVQGKDEIGSAS